MTIKYFFIDHKGTTHPRCKAITTLAEGMAIVAYCNLHGFDFEYLHHKGH